MNLSNPCIILGCGAHASSVISIVESSVNCYSIIGLVDLQDNFDPNETKSGYKVILSLKQLIERASDYKEVSCFIAIGDNSERKTVYEKLFLLGFKLPYVVSGHSVIDRTVKIGLGSIVSHGVIINSQVEIGNNNLINTGAIIEHHCIIEDHIHLAPKSLLCGNVKILEKTFVGAGAIVAPKNMINRNSIIAAGAVVISSKSNEGAKYMGVPARELVK